MLRFGKFELLACLESTDTRSSYLAKSDELVRLHLASADSDPRLFVAEAELFTELNGHGCVRVIEHGVLDGVTFVATEYVTGATLLELVAASERLGAGVPSHIAAAIIAEGARALAHVHHHTNGRPVSSLGLSWPQLLTVTSAGDSRAFGPSLWTAAIPTHARLPYTAPEIMDGDPTALSDVYALGVLAFECLAGPNMHGPNSPKRVRDQLRSGRTPSLSRISADVPKSLAEICTIALDPDPRERFDASEMAREIETFLGRDHHDTSPRAIERLLDRYLDRVRTERRVLRDVASGTYSEAALLKVLNAKRVHASSLPKRSAQPNLSAVPILLGKGVSGPLDEAAPTDRSLELVALVAEIRANSQRSLYDDSPTDVDTRPRFKD